MRDPAFLAGRQEGELHFNPIGGEELQQIVSRIVSPSPEVIEKVKDAIRPRNLQTLPGAKKGGGDFAGVSGRSA